MVEFLLLTALKMLRFQIRILSCLGACALGAQASSDVC